MNKGRCRGAGGERDPHPRLGDGRGDGRRAGTVRVQLTVRGTRGPGLATQLPFLPPPTSCSRLPLAEPSQNPGSREPVGPGQAGSPRRTEPRGAGCGGAVRKAAARGAARALEGREGVGRRVEEGVGGEEVKIEWADSISGSVAVKGIT